MPNQVSDLFEQVRVIVDEPESIAAAQSISESSSEAMNGMLCRSEPAKSILLGP